MNSNAETDPSTGASFDNQEPLQRAEQDRDGLLYRLKLRDRELEQARHDLQQFVHAASHDLQAPLRLISGFAQLLQKRYRGTLDSKADGFIDVINGETRRMQMMVQGLTELSRVESRGAPFVPTSLDASLDQALIHLHAEIRRTNAQIFREPLTTVMADPAQMIQLFRHLAGNALCFHGDAPPEIRIRAERQEAFWVITVRDNGIGIPERFAERVFMIFQKLQPHGQYPGIGIGLAVSKRIVERHGGRIWVKPGREPGATLCFSLPDRETGNTP
ncbi:MAG: hypothetical protein HQL81_12045 [Magnetococcales bacterium]|nr:hypothetical protein [Magnetococcales bacterium]